MSRAMPKLLIIDDDVKLVELVREYSAKAAISQFP